jgi:drug/metabolite transporter (DMT)-like permease
MNRVPPMRPLAGIFALLVAIAGWHYLFYSKAAQRLAHQSGGLEDDRTNRSRVHLRRANGVVMLLLAGFFFAGFYTVDPKTTPSAFVYVWTTVFFLMFVIVALALLDVRLTARLRRDRTKAKPPSISPP